jgi:hypothetical protein
MNEPMPNPTQVTLEDVTSIRGTRSLTDAEMAGIWGGKPDEIKDGKAIKPKVNEVRSNIKLDSIKVNQGAPAAGVKLNPTRPDKQNQGAIK